MYALRYEFKRKSVPLGYHCDTCGHEVGLDNKDRAGPVENAEVRSVLSAITCPACHTKGSLRGVYAMHLGAWVRIGLYCEICGIVGVPAAFQEKLIALPDELFK